MTDVFVYRKMRQPQYKFLQSCKTIHLSVPGCDPRVGIRVEWDALKCVAVCPVLDPTARQEPQYCMILLNQEYVERQRCFTPHSFFPFFNFSFLQFLCKATMVMVMVRERQWLWLINYY